MATPRATVYLWDGAPIPMSQARSRSVKALSAYVVTVFVIIVPIATAGGQNTTCQVYGNMMRCQTTQGVVQMQGWGADAARLGNVLGQAMAIRRQAQAQAKTQQAYTQALVEAERRAQAEAEANRRAADDYARRAQAQATIENEREAARQRLFAEKAVSVVIDVSQNFAFQGKISEFWIQSATTTLQDLYKVNPDASRLQIFDALAPKLDLITKAEVNYFIQHLNSPQLIPRLDSLKLDPAGEELQRFMKVGMKAVQPIFMEWPTEFNTVRFEQVMEPVYAMFRKGKTTVRPPSSAQPVKKS